MTTDHFAAAERLLKSGSGTQALTAAIGHAILAVAQALTELEDDL